MHILNWSDDDELDHQRYKNFIYTKEKIIIFKLIDLKKNLYLSGGLTYHNHMLNKIKKNLIKYERDLTKYKKNNSRY